MRAIGERIGNTARPYIFVSYSHRDTDRILPIIECLAKRGARLWYDGGIELGKEWAEDIERRIIECEVFLLFLSHSSIESINCREEFSLAREANRNILVCYIEDIKPSELRHGLRLRIPSHQCISLSSFSNVDGLCDELFRAQIITPCVDFGTDTPTERGADKVADRPHGTAMPRVEAGKSPAVGTAAPKTPSTLPFTVWGASKTVSRMVESRMKARAISSVPKPASTVKGGAKKPKVMEYSKGLKINEMGLLIGIGVCKDRDIIIPINVHGIANGAFRGCRQIESVVFHGGISVIPDDAFRGCVNLKSVTFSPCLKHIGARAFRNCVKLESIQYLGDKHTPEQPHIQFIGRQAFMNCKSLWTDTPPTLLELGERAYYGCALVRGSFTTSIRKIGRLALGRRRRTHASILYYQGTFEQWQQVKKNGKIMSCRVQYVKCNNGHEGFISEYSTDHIFK